MTEIDSEHAALLRALANNTNDKGAKQCYIDWLQERGNAGWLIVQSYPIQDWPLFVTDQKNRYLHYWRLPWLEGQVPYEYKKARHHLQKMKYILTEYAEGRVQ